MTRPKTLQNFGYEPGAHSGLYHSQNIMLKRLPLLVLNELRNVPHNAFVKSFASRQQAKEAAYEVLKAAGLQKLSPNVYRLITGLKRKWSIEMKVDMKEIEMTAEQVMDLGEDWEEFILSMLPAERFLKYIKPKEIVPYLDPGEVLPYFKLEERLAGLGPEERLAGLGPEEILSQFKPEEIEAYLRKLKS
jgi:hypothetical protein